MFEYFPFPHHPKTAAHLQINGKILTESYRLEQDEERLLETYSGIPLGNLLAMPPEIWLPYEMLPVYPQIVIEDTPYQVRGVLRPVRDQIEVALKAQNPNYEAGKLARIQQVTISPLDDIEDEIRVTILRPVSYTDAMATNLIADVPLADFGLELPFEVDTVRKLDMGFNGSLHPLEESICANPIGIAGLAISLDDKVLLMHRAAHLSTYADVLGASASGYVDWSDVDGESFHFVLRRALEREIAEELYLQPDETTDFTPYGVYREFYRGGFIQAFYGFRVLMSAEQLVARITEKGPHPEFQAMVAIPLDTDIHDLVLAGEIDGRPLSKELKALLVAATQYQTLY